MGRTTRIVGVLLVLAAAGYGIYVQVLKWHRAEMEGALGRSREAWKQETERLEREIAGLRQEMALRQEATLPTARLREVFGDDEAGMASAQGETSCEGLNGKVREFFAYLDGRDYIEAYGLDKGTLAYFQTMVGKLSEHPPEVSAELKDPYLLLKNVAHFYRVLGKQGVLLARDVIANESDIAEPVGALFFEWSSSGDRCRESLPGRPSLTPLYEYAGFFLHSLGGRSYLLRRDPAVRIMATYYSVLILDRANEEGLNRHGIDIRPHIDSVAEEIRNARGLVFRKDYLDTLEELKEKYTIR